MDKHFIRVGRKDDRTALAWGANTFIACVYTVQRDVAWSLEWRVLPGGHHGSPVGNESAWGKAEEKMLNSDSCSKVQSGCSWALHPGPCIKTVSVSKVRSKEASVKDFTALTKSSSVSEHKRESIPFQKECSIFALEEMQITEKGKEKYQPFPTHSKTSLMPFLASFSLFREKSHCFRLN